MSKVAGSKTSITPPDLATASRQSVADVFHGVGATAAGLTSDEAAIRRSRFGANVLATHRVTAFGVLLRQLRNPC